MNHYYAKQGAVIANDYANELKKCIEADNRLTKQLNALLGGKWNGMGASEHIGFRNWNEEECQYPVRMYVEPANKARILSYVKGMEKLLQPEVTGQGKNWY